MKKIDYQKLSISIAVPLLLGFLSGYLVDLSWYETLNKPFFTPPNWVFMPVWTILYILMGISFYLLWMKYDTLAKGEIFHLSSLYGLQLTLNVIWTPFFFYLNQIIVSLAIILFLLGILIVLAFEAYQVDKRSTYLLMPYILWIIIATMLNYGVIVLN